MRKEPFKLKTCAGERTKGLTLVMATLKLDVTVSFLYPRALGSQNNLLIRKRRAKRIITLLGE